MGFIVVLFFGYCCYNLISGYNPREEDSRYRLGQIRADFFILRTKNKEVRLCKRNRQLNTALRLMPKRYFKVGDEEISATFFTPKIRR